jgi:hypothetical protein
MPWASEQVRVPVERGPHCLNVHPAVRGTCRRHRRPKTSAGPHMPAWARSGTYVPVKPRRPLPPPPGASIPLLSPALRSSSAGSVARPLTRDSTHASDLTNAGRPRIQENCWCGAHSVLRRPSRQRNRIHNLIQENKSDAFLCASYRDIEV